MRASCRSGRSAQIISNSKLTARGSGQRRITRWRYKIASRLEGAISFPKITYDATCQRNFSATPGVSRNRLFRRRTRRNLRSFGGSHRCIEPVSRARTARRTSQAKRRSEAIASRSLLGRGGLGTGPLGRGAGRGGRREGAGGGLADVGLFLRFTAQLPRAQERPRKPTRQQGNRVTTKAREHETARP